MSINRDEHIWHIKKNWLEFNRQMNEYDRDYCFNCGRPTPNARQWRYCSNCKMYLKLKGLEQEYVTVGDVGKCSINYQYHLYIALFGCVITSKYRGKREERKKFKLQKKTVDKAVREIDKLILNFNNKHTELYKIAKAGKWKRVPEHMLYNVLLYFIAYYLEECDKFKSESHFFAAVCRALLGTINRWAIKSHGSPEIVKGMKKVRSRYLFIFYKNLIEDLDVIVQPILGEIIDGVYVDSSKQ